MSHLSALSYPFRNLNITVTNCFAKKKNKKKKKHEIIGLTYWGGILEII